MRSGLLYLLSLSLGVLAQQNQRDPPPRCNRLPSLNSEGQYVGVGPIKVTITADQPNGCTQWTSVNEGDWCGPQQVQAYAYKPGTKEFADTLYVQVLANLGESAISHTPGAYTATTFHTHEHVKRIIAACTYPAAGTDAVDLYLRVIYWPSTPTS